MKQNPIISVIVPVYKAEAYLHRCMDSLLSQTFTDFEILLVDDGSPDRSGEICDEYAKKDDRVRVFHKENGGVSSARQKGLDEARGVYVIHADPDDWVESDMLEELYKKAKEENADMVICDFYVNSADGQTQSVQKPSALDHETVLCELFQRLHGSCCNKLVRRACYNEGGVKFPKGVNFCEDFFVTASLLVHPLKMAYLPKAFYHYDQYTNGESIVRKYTRRRFEEEVRLLGLMEDVLRGSAAEKIGGETCRFMVISGAFSGHVFSSREYREKCWPYRKYCYAYHGNKVKRWFFSSCILASCYGFYRPAYSLWYNLRKLRRTIVSWKP